MSHQREDGNLTEEAINYIENGTYVSDCPANRKRSIRKKAGKLALREGEVYYEKNSGQICVFVQFLFYCLTIIYNNVSVFSG